VSKGLCSSGECGRPLQTRAYWRKDGKLAAAMICFRCDSMRVWAAFRQTPKSA
jgi:hypothetical protein